MRNRLRFPYTITQISSIRKFSPILSRSFNSIHNMCFTEDEQNNSFQNWSRWWWLQHMFYRGRMDTLKWSIIATISERKWTDVKWIPSGTERSPSPDPLLMMTSRIVLYWLRGCCLHNQWPARKSEHIPIYSLCGCLSSEGDLPRSQSNWNSDQWLLSKVY